jgi:hypothetical protein
MVHGDAHTIKDGLTFALDNTLNMKACFLLQGLVTFYELQKTSKLPYFSYQNKLEQDLHLYIIVTSNNLPTKWGQMKT